MADLFTLYGRIAINAEEANKKIDKVSFNAGGLAKTFKNIEKKAASFGKTVAKGAAAGAAALGVLAKASISSYADYEQMVGGIKTLFGADGKSLEEYAESVGKSVDDVSEKYGQLMNAQQTVFDNAKSAYKNAGLSATEYMKMATSISASLISGLKGDTERAAEYTDMAVNDMADNVSKFGNDAQMVQNAYRGFARGEYQMLNNLQLGYGGSRTEMQRLLKDARKISGVKYNIKNLNDVIEAIHVIQNEMGITGNAAAEASTTISGSWEATKAAWENLVMGLSDGNADIEQLFGNLTTSATNVAKNIGKVIPSLLRNMGTLVKSAGTALEGVWSSSVYPWLQDKFKVAFGIELPDWDGIKSKIQDKWPEVQAAFEEGGLVKVFQVLLPDWETVKTLISDGWKMVWAGVQGLFKVVFGVDIPSWDEIVSMISDGWNNSLLPEIKDFFKVTFRIELPSWESIKQQISDLWDKIKNWWNSIATNFGITASIQGSGTDPTVPWYVRDHAEQFSGYKQNASGLRRVPYDGFKARLHQNEAVLTASQAAIWRGERMPSLAGIGALTTPAQTEQPVNLTINISGNTNSPYEVAQAVRNAVDDWRWRG